VADAFRPLTLLLGALCLWALCLLILALSGLGSRFPAVTSADKPPPLPSVSLTRSVSRLSAMADYLEVGERPLMNLTRRPVAQSAVDGEAGAADLDVTLTSVLITPRLQLAILTDNKDGGTRRVRVGETVQGSAWRLLQLEPRSAVIEGPSGQRTLELRVFDGRSGEAPTPMAAAVDNDSEVQQPIQAIRSPPPPPTPTQPPANAEPAAKPEAAEQLTQEQQVEAIRRRIEARRAQMRAEAEAAGAKEK
jgi:general secretion pathway protein N